MTHPTNQSVFIFLDNANIFVPAQEIVDQLERPQGNDDVRIHVKNLMRLASAGRPIKRAYCAGTVSSRPNPYWSDMKANGFSVELFEPGAYGGREQAVDAALQIAMLRTYIDEAQPGIIVLLTGDGAGYKSSIGFHSDLERLKKKGWGIELIAWNKTCNGVLKTWVQENGVYIALEDYYQQVTYREHFTRMVKTVSLTHRKLAMPSFPQQTTVSLGKGNSTGKIEPKGAQLGQNLILTSVAQQLSAANSQYRPILKIK